MRRWRVFGGRIGPATATLVALTLAGVVAQSVGRHVVAPPFDVVDRFGARLVDVAAGEWRRLSTAAFVSLGGWPHALVNATGAVLVVGPLERRHGTGAALAVFAASATAAFAAGTWWHGPQWLVAGGSGLVVGGAGFVAARWSTTSPAARAGAVIVLVATFLVPLAAALLGLPTRGSVPAHLGGLAAGLVVGGAPERWRAVVAGAVAAVAVGTVIPLLVPLLPGPADLVSCRAPARSTAARGTPTRLLFLSDRDDVGVRWISPEGEAGDRWLFTDDRRGRMPWYGYEGALYEVVDGQGRCVIRARATRATSAVEIPG